MQTLYLIRCESFNIYKIGVAAYATERLADLQTGNPFRLTIEASFWFENAEIVERSLHQKYAGVRRNGEWFVLSEKQVKEFSRICDSLGGQVIKLPDATDEDIAEAEREAETKEILLGGLDWRLEMRNDRKTPGYAIYRRGGERIYLGYVGTRNLKDPAHPTVEEVEDAIKRSRHGQE